MNLDDTQKLAANVAAARDLLKQAAIDLALSTFTWANLEGATVCLDEAYSLAVGAGQPALLDDIGQLKAQVERALEGLRFLDRAGEGR